MIKVLIGKKGSGKTKTLIDSVNNAAHKAEGNVVYISSDTKRHMFDIKHSVRLVDTSAFVIKTYDEFYGFLCGLISNNFDITNIYVDSIFKIVGVTLEGMDKFFEDVENLCESYNIDFMFTLSMEAAGAPEYIKKYL